jgi:rubrerythrin
MDNTSLSEALNNAVEMEQKGYDFYKNAAQKSKNKVTKKTFDFLAENEVFHIDNIRNFYDSLKGTGHLPSADLDSVKAKRTEDINLFSKNIKELDEKISAADDDKKACEFAMDFEKYGYNYYENMLNEAEDDNLKKLLSFLLSEEKRHYNMLEELHTYITDSGNWFMYEEGTFPQG